MALNNNPTLDYDFTFALERDSVVEGKRGASWEVVSPLLAQLGGGQWWQKTFKRLFPRPAQGRTLLMYLQGARMQHPLAGTIPGLET